MPEETDESVWETISPLECSSLMNCVLCKKVLTETSEDILGSQLLLCFHSICRTCVESWKNEGEKRCPACYVPLQKLLLENKVLQECVEQPQSDSLRRGTCDMHPNDPAKRWCNDCRSLVCDFCVDNHKNLISTRFHKIVDADENNINSNTSLVDFSCEQHKSMQLEIYCLTCNQMTCRDCQLEKHKQHSYSFINDMCRDYKRELIIKRAKISMFEETLMASHRASEELQKNVLVLKRELQESIDRIFQLLMNALKKRFLDLKNQLDSFIDDDIKILTLKMKATNENLELAKHCISVLDLFLHFSSDPTIVFSKDHLEKFFELLSLQKVEVVNPNVERKVHFSTPNQQLPNLLESIKTIGKFSCTTSGMSTTPLTNTSTEQEREERVQPNVTPRETAPPPTSLPPPHPVRIQLRQDLQSTDPLRNQDRVDKPKGPENASKPIWHIPEERPPSDPAPTSNNITSCETLGRLLSSVSQSASQSKAPTSQVNLQISLQPNNQFQPIRPSGQGPNVQGIRSNLRSVAPQSEPIRYSVITNKTLSYSVVPTETAPSNSVSYVPVPSSTVDSSQTTTPSVYYAQNMPSLTISYATPACSTGPNRRVSTSRQNPSYLQEHGTPAPLVQQYQPPPMANQYGALPPYNSIQRGGTHQSNPPQSDQEMLYFPGSTHNPYPS